MKALFDKKDNTTEYDEPETTRGTDPFGVPEHEPQISYELLRQLVANHFLTVVVRRTATPNGLIEKPIFSMVNQSGRGREKMTLEISFCPITGIPLNAVDFAKLRVDGQISF
jgi:hypothetical protein